MATTSKKKPAKKTATKKNLVIVESPSKAKTIGKFLGSRYKVVASVGHVRDLPKSKLGIRIEDDFEPEYISIRGKGDVIKSLRKEAKAAGKVYLATDPDREGEAISWHLAYLLGIDVDTPCRIVFNEITKKAITDAVKEPREIDVKLVDAQQARRVLDRLVGYQISPLLWRKIRRGLSAGRVQSAALKIICDREKERNTFVPEEFWNIEAHFADKPKWTAKLIKSESKKITVRDEATANKILEDIKKRPFVVESVGQKDRNRKAYPPFTTSSLQQEASVKLNFNTKKTMQIAQQLYEGIDIKGKGTVGLVTYIRTDSVRISDEAQDAVKAFVTENYGSEYFAKNVFKNKKKDIQDAHEAIRPSDVALVPCDIKDSLTKDQHNLYRLIWNRFVASSMAAAKYLALTVNLKNGVYDFRANGSTMIFDGFLKVYGVGKEDGDTLLPAMEVDEEKIAAKVDGEQSFTQPPARFTEATLIKNLEERDIGRPSTYAPIVGTLVDRKYVQREKKSLVPTELGFLVTNMLTEYFKDIVDAGFTAEIEDRLDAVEIENVQWKDIIRDFYKDFAKELAYADEKIEKIDVEPQLTDQICEKCGKPMAIKQGRFGEFLACSGYPDCKNTKPIVKSTGVACPLCGSEIVQRKSKKGRFFYGCSGYPKCENLFWDKPIDKKCPRCGSLMTEKKTKNGQYACSNKKCDYKE